MTEPTVTRQTGASSSTQSRLQRYLQMLFMRRALSERTLLKQRAKIERERIKNGLPHCLDIFIQIDDPYSYLLLQALNQVQDKLNCEFRLHLTHGVDGNNNPEPTLLKNLALTDAHWVAPGYGLIFPESEAPTPAATAAATVAAARCLESTQVKVADLLAVIQALWSGDSFSLPSEQEQQQAAQQVEAGTARQKKMGHYAGAMIHYGGEWYWGVDRLYHLEHRLCSLGIYAHPLFDRPAVIPPSEPAEGYQLEFYLSLRSPYSAICFDAVCDWADSAGVTLVLKPVLPMVMRGVTLSRAKGLYIMKDCAREARTLNKQGYGNFYDPIGEGVIRGFSIYPLATAMGKERAYLKSFMDGAFCEGVNSLSDRGLRNIVERSGLPWQAAQEALQTPNWGAPLEQNRKDMYAWGSWGVPSFRLIAPDERVVAQAWGQDRLWRLSQVLASDMQT